MVRGLSGGVAPDAGQAVRPIAGVVSFNAGRPVLGDVQHPPRPNDDADMTFVSAATEGDEIEFLGLLDAPPSGLCAIDQAGNLLPLISRGIFPCVGWHRKTTSGQDEPNHTPAVHPRPRPPARFIGQTEVTG